MTADTVRSATIETLTAEVRVLMVGSRQVTLSVARQLDAVPLSDLEVFGRIRIRDGEDHVIGASREGRHLAVARYHGHDDRSPVYVDIAGMVSPPMVCDQELAVQGYLIVGFGGRPIQFLARDVVRCGLHLVRNAEKCDGWQPNDAAEAIVAEIAARDAENVMHRGAASSPLIVLAGLK